MEKDKKFYNWDDFDKDIEIIINHIKEREWDIKYVFGIPKGGLVFGVTIANILNVPLLPNLDSITPEKYGQIENILICDDISDSGKTLINIKNIIKHKTITLFISEETQFIPNFYVRKSKKTEWICFPWEENKHLKNITETKKGYETTTHK